MAEDSMLEVYIYETQQLLQSLDDVLLEGESEKRLTEDQINEVFRSMHTIKGASAMMEFNSIMTMAHAVEDVFSYIREFGAPDERWPEVFDVAFRVVSFINGEMPKIQSGATPDGEDPELVAEVHKILAELKAGGAASTASAEGGEAAAEAAEEAEPAGQTDSGEPFYKVKVTFETGCQMETVRALGVKTSLAPISVKIATIPEKLDSTETDKFIVQNGLCVYLQTAENPDEIKKIMDETLFLQKYSVLAIDGTDEEIPESIRIKDNSSHAAAAAVEKPAEEASSASKNNTAVKKANEAAEASTKQNFISVNVNKLDSLLNIVGEIVTAQSMVISNANFSEGRNDSFDIAAKQLRSLINELQDVVMSIRMLPVSNVFQKMKRIVRDMSKKIDKDIELVLVGEETEVDKNVIDCLSDPLMHLVRNSVDHGIESPEEREAAGKPKKGHVYLEAKTTGNDVIVSVTDDGKGLNRQAILRKAYEKGLINKPESDVSDKDVYSLIFLPGFSTKEQVTEYSGRGVGMDVVRRNISQIGGSLSVDSTPGKGTTFTIRIPLTLTIVDGMKFHVGDISFIMPTASVQTVLRPGPGDVFVDSNNNEMIILHGQCYSVARMSDLFGIENAIQNPEDGMIMHLIAEGKSFCILFDNLDGEYQVVAKSLPEYLKKCATKLDGISGCAIMGDGSINLILDVNNLATK